MKIKFLPILLILCLLAAGCAESTGNDSSVASDESKNESITSEPETPAPESKPTWDTAPRDIEFTGHFFGGEFQNLLLPEDADTDAITLLATTKAELTEITESCVSSTGFSEFAAGLDEEYFNEKAIIISACISGTASTVFELENVRVDEKGITVTVSEKTPMVVMDMMLPLLMTAEINKSDIGECKTVRTEIEERVYPLSGTVGEYDTTPRDIEFTPYTFNYIIEGRTIGSADGVPDFSIETHGDLFFIFRPEFENLHEYGKGGDDIEKYFNKGNDYFKDKALLVTYAASDNGKSHFEISSLRADENGITMTVTHSLADEAETENVYSILVAEVDVSFLAGCEIYNLVFEDPENTLTSPYKFPEPFTDNPYNDINVNDQTPEGYGSEILEEPDFIGSVYRPVYVYLTDRKLQQSTKDEKYIKLSGITLELYDNQGNLVQRSITNSDGVARFVVRYDKTYHVGFAGNEEFFPCDYAKISDTYYCSPYSNSLTISFIRKMDGPAVDARNFILSRKSDFVYQLGKATLRFVDKATGEPIEGASVKFNRFSSDENGSVSVTACLPSDYIAVADGYNETRFTLLEDGQTRVIEMEPVTAEYVEIEITVTDKLTGKPIQGAIAGLQEYSSYVGENDCVTDENGVAVLLIAKEDFYKPYSYFRIGVRADGYLSYCSFAVDKENGIFNYKVGMHNLKSELLS